MALQPVPCVAGCGHLLTDRRSILNGVGDRCGKKAGTPGGRPAAPARPTGSTPSEPGFLYHATSHERALEIAESGKLLTHKPWDYTDQGCWPDGGEEKRSYFSPKAHVVWQF